MKKTLTIIVGTFIAITACFGLGFWIGGEYHKARDQGEMKAQITLLEKNQKEHLRILTRHTDLLEAMGYRFEALEKDRQFVLLDTLVIGSDYAYSGDSMFISTPLEVICTQ